MWRLLQAVLVQFATNFEIFIEMLFTTDTLFSKVRQTSHKPDEIYGVIERLSPGTRKIGKQVLHAFINGL